MFELDELHAALWDSTRTFVHKELAPHALEFEDAGAISADALKRFGMLELWGLTLPESAGGAEFGRLAYALVVEALASGSPSLAHRFALHAGPASAALQAAGVPLQEVAAGALATYADGGTRAPRPESYLVVSVGTKCVVHRSWSAEPVATMGLRAAGLATIKATDEGVPCECDAQAWADLGVAAACVGVMEGALAAAVEYAKERQQFGRPLARFQAIQWKLADGATALDAARLMVRKAALSQRAEDAAAARVLAGRSAVSVCSEALQVHGGYGYTREYPVERFFRAARQWSAAPDRARELIARSALA